MLGRTLKATEAVGHAGVRVAAHRLGSELRKGLNIRSDLIDSQRAVDADAKHVELRHGNPEGFQRLSGKRPAAFEDGAGNHHRHTNAVLGEELINREQTRLEYQGIERCLGQEEIDAAGHQAGYLICVVGDHLVKGDVPMGGVVDMDADAQTFVGRTDAAGCEAGLVRSSSVHGLRGMTRQLGRLLVDLKDKLAEPILRQTDACGIKSVGLDDVGACLQILAMNVFDDLRLSEDQ